MRESLVIVVLSLFVGSCRSAAQSAERAASVEANPIEWCFNEGGRIDPSDLIAKDPRRTVWDVGVEGYSAGSKEDPEAIYFKQASQEHRNYIRDEKCRDLLDEWVLGEPARQGELRFFVGTRESVQYRAGTPGSDFKLPEHAFAMIFIDGGMNATDPDAYQLLDLTAWRAYEAGE